MNIENQQQQKIIELHRERSTSYFDDNYRSRKNALRIARFSLFERILTDVVAPDMTILDAGAGPAVLAEIIRQRSARYIAMDLSWDNLWWGKKRVHDIKSSVGDVKIPPFRDESLGGVVCMGCLEYVPKCETAISQFARIVQKDGFVLASFANRRSPGRWWDMVVAHPLVRLKKRIIDKNRVSYSRFLHSSGKIRQAFNGAGLEVKLIQFYNPGLLGFPLSEIDFLQSCQSKLSNKLRILQYSSLEYLILAIKR